MKIKKVLGISAVLLLFAALVPSLNAQTLLLEEDFDDTWSTTAPPAGWTITYDGTVDNNDWYRYTGSVTSGPGTGWSGGKARINWSPSQTSTDRLISPIVDCSDASYTSIWVAFDIYYDDYSGALTSQFRGSNDGGSSYPQVITDYDLGGGAANYGPLHDSIDVSAWALGQNDVRFDFYRNGYTYNMDYWYLDNFRVWAGTGGGGDSLVIDLAMVAINRPYDEEEAGVAFTPSCKVANYTDTLIVASVRCVIEEFGVGDVYTDQLSNYPFDPGYNDVDAFKNFTPEANKRYNAFFVVEHPEDINPDNNDLDKDFKTAGITVNPVEILAPTASQQGGFSPSAKFREMLGIEAADVTMRCEISDMAYHAVVYQDSVGPETFTANEEKTATFSTVALDEGSYSVRFWATDAKNTMVSNPDTTMTFAYIAAIAEAPVVKSFGLNVTGNKVSFSLANATKVNLRVYDVAGNMITSLASGSYNAGSYSVDFDGKPGVYFVKLVTPEFTKTSKLVVLY